MKKAQSLDPLSLIINADFAELLLIAHDVNGSIEQSRKTIEMDANFPLAHNQLGVAYLASHRPDEAIPELQRAVHLSGGSATCAPTSRGRSPNPGGGATRYDCSTT
jgi:hypothetical protein